MSNKISYIEYHENEPSVINFADGRKIESKCINCKNKKCIKFRNDEIRADDVHIPINISDNVCPVNAISYDENMIKIDSQKCIKCGLCASRCTTGAIYFDKNKFVVNNIETMDLDEEQFENVNKTGNIILESDELINSIYDQITSKNIDPNLFSRNLMIQCGILTSLTRKGDVNLRMDGIIVNENKKGVCEIEFNNDVLSCPRCILDDLAVLCSRYDYDLHDTLALVITLCLPNNRTDYWRVIKDISDILNINIQTISIGFLLIALWNNKKIILTSNEYFCNSDNNSLKEKINNLLNRQVNIIQDKNGVLDPKK